MTRHVTSLGVHRTALVGAICAAVIALVVALLITPLMMLIPRSAETPGMAVFSSGIMLVVMPVVYFVIGYVFTAIWVGLFNLVAPRLGGIPITFADEEPPAAL